MKTSTDLGSRAAQGKQVGATCAGEELKPWTDLVDYAREYTRERPEVVACLCFGVGFILGWKLKPW